MNLVKPDKKNCDIIGKFGVVTVAGIPMLFEFRTVSNSDTFPVRIIRMNFCPYFV